MSDPHPEEVRRSEVTVAQLVEDHPDPAGDAPTEPLQDPDPAPEDINGW